MTPLALKSRQTVCHHISWELYKSVCLCVCHCRLGLTQKLLDRLLLNLARCFLSVLYFVSSEIITILSTITSKWRHTFEWCRNANFIVEIREFCQMKANYIKLNKKVNWVNTSKVSGDVVTTSFLIYKVYFFNLKIAEFCKDIEQAISHHICLLLWKDYLTCATNQRIPLLIKQ